MAFGDYQPLVQINKKQALYRGRPPPNVDRVATEQVLEDGEKDLDVYSAELARLHSETVRLEQKKAVLTEYLDRHRSSVASIWRIPNEVLALIFTLVCCERVRINQPPLAGFHCGANLPQLLIGSVCSVWRSILYSLPDCWTNFAVSFLASMPHPSLIQMFLDLSDPKNLFLDITFSQDSDHQEIIAHPSYYALTGQVHRWQELILFGSHLENINVLRQPTIKACPRLKRLRLDGFFAVGVEPKMDLAPMPLLEQLEACLYDPYGPDPSIPWHQLKSLQLHAAVDIPTCLALCENLFSLSLYMRETTLQYSTEPSSKSVTLKSLRSFMLSLTPLVPAGEEGGAESLNQIVDLLSFPSLNTLVVQPDDFFYPGIATWPSEVMTSFIQRCSSKLTKLTVAEVSISDDELIAFLREAPLIEELTVEEYEYTLDDNLELSADPNLENVQFPITPNFVRSLHVGKTDTARVILPNLRSLSLAVNKHPVESEIVEMIVSRQLDAQEEKEMKVVPLTTVNISLNWPDLTGRMIDMDKLKPLFRLQSEPFFLDVDV